MRLTYVVDNHYGDWEGLYVDGRLVDEGHQVDWPRALRKAGLDVETVETNVSELPGERLPAEW